MKGSTGTKLVRIAASLASHPHWVPFYIGKSLNNSTSPLELELPWISLAAIEFLKSYASPSHKVAEFGGGGSTLFFAKRVQSVLCIESHDLWTEKIQTALTDQKIENVQLVSHPYDPDDSDAFRKSEYLNAISGESYDIILIDGFEDNVPLRPICFEKAEDQINKGGIIVLDDSWRHAYLRTQNKAKRVRTFKSIGPCRPGVTTTDVFFY